MAMARWTSRCEFQRRRLGGPAAREPILGLTGPSVGFEPETVPFPKGKWIGTRKGTERDNLEVRSKGDGIGVRKGMEVGFDRALHTGTFLWLAMVSFPSVSTRREGRVEGGSEKQRCIYEACVVGKER
eukprot:scaffold1368_cov333-Pavlova_lutheri.AAC.8